MKAKKSLVDNERKKDVCLIIQDESMSIDYFTIHILTFHVCKLIKRKGALIIYANQGFESSHKMGACVLDCHTGKGIQKNRKGRRRCSLPSGSRDNMDGKPGQRGSSYISSFKLHITY